MPRARNGLSEAITIMVVILIAVSLGFGLKAWYDSQMRKLPATEMATAEWSATFGNNRWIVTLNVRNNLDRSISLEDFRITLNDGTVYTKASSGTSMNPSLPLTIGLKSSNSTTIVFSGTSDKAPVEVIAYVRDPTTGATANIKAVGGVQI